MTPKVLDILGLGLLLAHVQDFWCNPLYCFSEKTVQTVQGTILVSALPLYLASGANHIASSLRYTPPLEDHTLFFEEYHSLSNILSGIYKYLPLRSM